VWFIAGEPNPTVFPAEGKWSSKGRRHGTWFEGLYMDPEAGMVQVSRWSFTDRCWSVTVGEQALREAATRAREQGVATITLADVL